MGGRPNFFLKASEAVGLPAGEHSLEVRGTGFSNFFSVNEIGESPVVEALFKLFGGVIIVVVPGETPRFI
jgi:hypothetical protein